MKPINFILLAAFLVVLYLYLSLLGRAQSTKEVVMPTKVNPVEVQRDTIYITKWKLKDTTVYVETKNPVNDSLLQAYELAADSLERFRMYVEAIQLRGYETQFEDHRIEITFSTEVQGVLNRVTPKYTIKEAKPSLYVGGHIGMMLPNHSPGAGMSVSVKTRKDKILNLSVSNFNTGMYTQAGLVVPIR